MLSLFCLVILSFCSIAKRDVSRLLSVDTFLCQKKVILHLDNQTNLFIMEKKYTIGVDVGGGSTTIAVVDREGNIVESNKEELLKTSNYTKGESFVNALCIEIDKLIDKVGKDNIRGVGIGAPNSSPITGIIESAPNLFRDEEAGKPIEIVRIASSKLNVPVYLDNDANAAALGELKYGAGKDDPELKNFIVITLGTGLGSGIISNGSLVHGKHGTAGELGHVVVQRRLGRKCGCGRLGCLEAYASAKGMARTAIEFLEVGRGDENEVNALREVYERRKNKGLIKLHEEESYKEDMLISSKDVAIAAKKGDKMALEIFDYTAKILGESLAEFVAFSDPQKIFLFGGLANSADMLLEPVNRYMNEHLLNIYRDKNITVDISLLNDNALAAVLGASALVK